MINVRLGRLDEARAVIAEFLKNEPGYSMKDIRLNIGKKYKDPAVVEQLVANLRIAGFG